MIYNLLLFKLHKFHHINKKNLENTLVRLVGLLDKYSCISCPGTNYMRNSKSVQINTFLVSFIVQCTNSSRHGCTLCLGL